MCAAIAPLRCVLVIEIARKNDDGTDLTGLVATPMARIDMRDGIDSHCTLRYRLRLSFQWFVRQDSLWTLQRSV